MGTLGLAAIVAVTLGVWRAHSPSAPSGTVVRVIGSPPGDGAGIVGESAPQAREPLSAAEWAALLPRLEKAAAGGDRDAKRRVALALYDLGRLDEAQTAYERLLADEEDAVLRNRLGNVLRDRGDLSGAEAAYRRALSTDPTLPAPYVNLAELLWRARRGEEALAVLEQGRDAVSKEARPVLEKAMASLRNTAPSGPTTTAPATAPASSPPAQTE